MVWKGEVDVVDVFILRYGYVLFGIGGVGG